MTGFAMTPARIWLRNAAGIEVFDSAKKAFNLVPDAALAGTVSLAFPNFSQAGTRYIYQRRGSSKPYQESCSTVGYIGAQDWGPGKPNNIARVHLGAVPAGTDYLDVQASFIRTAAPALILGFPILPAIAEGQTMSLFDGGAVLEDKGNIKRGVHIGLDGTNVFASLYQSASEINVKAVEAKTDLSVFYLPGSDPFPDEVFWTKQYGGTDQCAMAWSLNLASTWSMTFKVTPGRIT